MELASHNKLFQTTHNFQPRLSLLLYTDDLIICVKSSKEVAITTKELFHNLEEKVCLKLHETKNKCCINKFCKERYEVLDILWVEEGELPVKYLGVPLSSNKITDRECAKLIIKIRNKLQGWSSRLLSFAGRIELVHTVIQVKINFRL